MAVYPDAIVDKFVVDDGHVANPAGSFQVRGVYPSFFVASVCGETCCGDHVAFGVPGTRPITITAGFLVGDGHYVGGTGVQFGVPHPTYSKVVGGVGSGQLFGTPKFQLRAPPGGVPTAQQFGVPTAVNLTIPPQTVAVKGLAPGGAGYSGEVLADAPALYWRLNGDASDASGHGRNGTPTGALQWGVPGPISDGTAVRATATGQRVSVPTFPAAEAAPFSYEFWWKPNPTQTDYSPPVVKTTSDAWNDGFGCYWMTANHALFFWVGLYSRSTYLEPPAPGLWTGWTHFVYVYDGNTQRAYVNGVLGPDGVKTIGAIPVATAAPLSLIGASVYEAPGDYDEFAFYDKALTPARIAAHYAAASVAVGPPQFGTITTRSTTPAAAGGVPSAQAFGAVTTVSTSPPQTKAVSGLGSAQAFGAPAVKATVTRTVGGVGSAQAFGTPTTRLTQKPGGVPSAQQFGVPRTRVTVPTGAVDSAQAFGTPDATTKQRVSVPGVRGSSAYADSIVDQFKVDDGHVVNAESSASYFGTPWVGHLWLLEADCIDFLEPAVCGAICGNTICGGTNFIEDTFCYGNSAIVNTFFCGQMLTGELGASFLASTSAASIVDQFVVDDGHVVDGELDGCLDSPLPAICDPGTICGTVVCGGASYIAEIECVGSLFPTICNEFICGQLPVSGSSLNPPITVTRTIDLQPAGCL